MLFILYHALKSFNINLVYENSKLRLVLEQFEVTQARMRELKHFSLVTTKVVGYYVRIALVILC